MRRWNWTVLLLLTAATAAALAPRLLGLADGVSHGFVGTLPSPSTSVSSPDMPILPEVVALPEPEVIRAFFEDDCVDCGMG